jgi:serine O-acetyltransferase
VKPRTLIREDYRQLVGRRPTGMRIVARFMNDHGFRAVCLYRWGHYFFEKNLRILARLCQHLMLHTAHCSISVAARIGPGLTVRHVGDIVVGGRSVIGSRFDIRQGVTIGGNTGKQVDGRSQPLIGDDVRVGAGAKILGPVRIGNGVIVGANSVVVSDVPDEAVVVGIPARVIRRGSTPVSALDRDDPIARKVRELTQRVEHLEAILRTTPE